MRFYRCKCGDHTAQSSMGVQPCVTCAKCGSTLGESPSDHPDPEPHEWVTRYDNHTGAPYEMCSRCMTRKPDAKDGGAP